MKPLFYPFLLFTPILSSPIKSLNDNPAPLVSHLCDPNSDKINSSDSADPTTKCKRFLDNYNYDEEIEYNPDYLTSNNVDDLQLEKRIRMMLDDANDKLFIVDLNQLGEDEGEEEE